MKTYVLFLFHYSPNPYHLYHLLRKVPDPMVQRVARFCRRCVTNGGFAVL